MPANLVYTSSQKLVGNSVNVTPSVTACFWMKCKQNGWNNYGVLYGYNSTNGFTFANNSLIGTPNYLLWQIADGVLALTNYNIVLNYDIQPVNQVWKHIAGVWDNSLGTGALYIDGAWVASGSPVIANPRSPASLPVQVGAINPTGNTFNGYIEDARVYSRVLTANEIQTIYEGQGDDGNTDGLEFHCNTMRGQHGSTIPASFTDTSPKQISITAVNTPVWEHGPFQG